MPKPNSGGKRVNNKVNKLVNRVTNPTTKDDFIARLKVIGEVGEPSYKTVVKTTDWNNYGKSRTYLKIDAYRESDGKYHHSMDYGYYDNNTKSYVKRINTMVWTITTYTP